jgi:hypothetical protein
MENKNIIKDSFDKLIYSFTDTDKETNQLDNFCNSECYEKFLKVIDKIKKGQIDINNLNLSGENNMLANMLSHYYNAGYMQGSLTK